MPYMIQATDKPDALALRTSTRPAHLKFLAENAAKLLACGALLDEATGEGIGSLYILDTEDRAEAEAFIAADPFSSAGVFGETRVVRWRKAYLDGRSYLPPS
ncbi:YciI family protein [Teichococcus vastitatis]|uniref:YciI family protein n=1 Tax=Teichococcus vastitatis TaxID=2307076 RepID=A0ABS9W3M1_9PROT|nr:YciI family protein [Pseudoroseomonas vastitatis]MCI0753884.1 YciI family protein [Pseudoroseomonas vastitatis]